MSAINGFRNHINVETLMCTYKMDVLVPLLQRIEQHDQSLIAWLEADGLARLTPTISALLIEIATKPVAISLPLTTIKGKDILTQFHELVRYLSIMQTQPDPAYARQLLVWIQAGGLSSFKDGLLAYLHRPLGYYVTIGIPFTGVKATIITIGTERSAYATTKLTRAGSDPPPTEKTDIFPSLYALVIYRGVDGYTYLFAPSAEALLVELREKPLSGIQTAELWRITAPKLELKYSKAYGGEGVIAKPLALTGNQRLLDREQILPYISGLIVKPTVPELFKDCLSYDAFMAKYKPSQCLGEGESGAVLLMSYDSHEYAVKLACLDTNEYQVALKITENKALLPNVTLLHDCAVLNRERVLEEKTLHLCEKIKNFHVCTTYILALVYDVVTSTLGQLARDISKDQPYAKITSLHLFELYYTVYRLLQLGIHPDDMHTDNVGLARFGPLTYTVCGCTFVVPEGLHVKLIDYGYYDIREKPRSISQLYMIEMFKQLKFDRWLTPNKNFDDATLLMWKVLTSYSTTTPEVILLDVALNILKFPCASIEMACLAPLTARQYLWSSLPLDFSPYTDDQSRYLDSIWSKLKYNSSVEGLQNFAFDYIRSQYKPVLDIGFVEELKRMYEKLSLRQQLYYISLNDASTLQYHRQYVYDVAKRETRRLSSLIGMAELQNSRPIYLGYRFNPPQDGLR